MSELQPFMMNIFPMPILQERAAIINDLTRYMTYNWRDPYRGDMDPRVEVFRQSVQGHVARHFFDFHEMPVAVRKKIRQPGNTCELVLSAYDEAVRFDNSELIAVPHFSDYKLIESFTEHFSAAPYSAQLINIGEQEEPSVLGAYKMACKNFSQAQTRKLTFSVLQRLLQVSEFSSHSKLAEADALLAQLYRDISAAMKDMLLFSGLLGGAAHAHTTKLVARQMCHKESLDDIQYSIMHFITADRRHPGVHLVETADSLKDDIRRKYEAL